MFCSRCGTQVDTSVRFCPTCGLDLSSVTGAGQGQTARMAAAPAPEQDETTLIREALKDEYDLEKELGRGGMAVVYKGRDKQLEREVAIKVLPFSLSFDAEFVERFQREARTAGKLEHPNIIPIYRVGKSGRVIYFVMKFIRGKSLSAVIEARGALPVPETKRFLIEASRALGYAHKHGIVHRDIKPDNIMFDELGQAIVADFGIAKAQSGAKLTGTGMSIGTPHYMSPEQARAQNLDGRSDIYSLGVVGYQALTGRVPFDGEDSFSIGYKHIMEELPTPPLDTAEQREMFAVVQRMMAKKPDDRFQTAEELIQALEAVGGGASSGSMTDMSTMPTRAIEPMKAPTAKGAAPPMAGMATAPLPRASASMGKPAESTAAPPSPPAKKAGAGARPQKQEAKGGKGGMIAAVAAVVLLGGGAGAYFGVIKPGQARQEQARADSVRADSTRRAALALAAADSVRRDSVTADSAAGSSKRPTPTRDTTTRRPDPTPPPPTGPDGTLRLEGTIPSGAQVRIAGRTIPATGGKLPPGRHNLAITATGYQPYNAVITITSNQVQRHTVTMVAAAPPDTTTRAPRTADCSRWQVSNNNPGQACWDSRPQPRTAPTATAPADCQRPPQRVSMVVRVSASGDVIGTPFPYRNSGCSALDQAAAAAVSDVAFLPAQKDGRAVEAYVVIPVTVRRN
jgi:predicted Ser/Thr protein kinase